MHGLIKNALIREMEAYYDGENGADNNFYSDDACDCGKKTNDNSENGGSLTSTRRPKVILELMVHLRLLAVSLLSHTCLQSFKWASKFRFGRLLVGCCFLLAIVATTEAYATEFDKTERFLDKINLEQSIAAVFNKVAYGSTTKRSIPDNSYPVTTLATPLLTTYRYSDGSDEWLRVDIKNPDYNDEEEEDEIGPRHDNTDENIGYGSDLEKDHGLPTSAPAADILKNNNNRHYNNPNRYNNDRLRPEYFNPPPEHAVTENIAHKPTTTSLIGQNAPRNVPRPTKSIYSKDVPSYVPPSRAFFTPPLPPEYINPFADKPTLRGTNSDTFANRRPIPPPSLMPNKDRIPFRPDLPPSKTVVALNDTQTSERKKTLNTPSQNVNTERLGEFYGLRNLNESSFEYEKGYIPTITRILSGSNGRHDDIPDVLLKMAAATTTTASTTSTTHRKTLIAVVDDDNDEQKVPSHPQPPEEVLQDDKPDEEDVAAVTMTTTTTTQNSDALNLANVKQKDATNANNNNNVTKATTNEVWLICWNVHVYLVVLIYVLLAAFSIYKLIRYENDPHMFTKAYFLTVHLMLTVICVLRVFYLTYDPYNVARSFNVFLYEFLHNFPLSLLATTFAVLILFLLKRTLNHLKVKTRPVFLVVFAVMHICLCFALSVLETLGHFERASLVVCKPVFVLLTWALGFSYLYLYKIIKNVLAKKSQQQSSNLSEICTQNIGHASHITIAVALLFVLLGFVQLYALFFIKVDRFDAEIRHHWILWGFELSVRVLEIAIVALLAIVVSLRMSQREKQTVGFPLFPCTTSDSSGNTDNVFPNNCATNPNVLNYGRRNETMVMEDLPPVSAERPNLIVANNKNDSVSSSSTLERYRAGIGDVERFERPKWGSERFERAGPVRNTNYDKYYAPKPRYELELDAETTTNVYSEPIIESSQYLERNDFDRRSRNSSNTSGRRSTGRSNRKNHARPHLGVQTLPPAHNDNVRHLPDTMLVDDQGFVRFRHLQDMEQHLQLQQHHQDKPKKLKKQQNNDLNHHHYGGDRVDDA